MTAHLNLAYTSVPYTKSQLGNEAHDCLNLQSSDFNTPAQSWASVIPTWEVVIETHLRREGRLELKLSAISPLTSVSPRHLHHSRFLITSLNSRVHPHAAS